jgi:hypothetical protein
MRLLVARLIAIVLVIAATLVVLPGAALGLQWTQLPQPANTTATVSSNACGTPSGPCINVGTYKSNGGPGFAFSWFNSFSGASGMKATPNPAGATASELDGVSCIGALCHAVGMYTTGSGTKLSLAIMGTSSSWTIKTTPNPAGATISHLSGVSCTTSSACTAVGDATVSGVQTMMAMAWNGTAWILQTLPTFFGASATELNDVKCLSATACFAVGMYTSTSGTKGALALSWNGTTWTIQATPTPAGATITHLRSISCTATTECTAVGDAQISGVLKTLAMRWNGTAWSLQTTPNPSSYNSLHLKGVACTSATSCLAAGDLTTSVAHNGLLLSWNGTTWSIASPAPPAGNALADIACASAVHCLAVGDTGGLTWPGVGPSIAHWDGSTWTTLFNSGFIATQTPDVSCGGVDDCMVVGSYLDFVTGIRSPIARHWNGTTWSESKPPVSSPGSGAQYILNGVSCASAARCIAVGSGNAQALAESWNGTTWTQLTVATPAGAVTTAFQQVWCSLANSCSAVGNYSDSSGNVLPLYETWDGTSWTIQPVTTLPAGYSNFALFDVQCTAAAHCTAVGKATVTGGSAPFAVRWDGTTATAQSPPQHGAGLNTNLYGISCPTTTLCLAAGTESLGGPDVWERWDGTSWTVQTDPPGYNIRTIYCTTPEVCRVLGGVYKVYEWDGTTWTTQATMATPNTLGNTAPQSLSCVSLNWCMAVGDAYAERWS